MLAIRSAVPVEPLHLSITDSSVDAMAPRTSIGSRRNPESTRAILAAAGDILAEHGYAGFSVDAIARRARCGKPTVYRWWTDKLALLIELHDGELAALPESQNISGWMGAVRAFWESSLAGPALRAIAAEAQLSDEGRDRLRAAVAPYEANALTTLDGRCDPALARTAASVAIFSWLSDGKAEMSAPATEETSTSDAEEDDYREGAD